MTNYLEQNFFERYVFEVGLITFSFIALIMILGLYQIITLDGFYVIPLILVGLFLPIGLGFLPIKKTRYEV